MKRYNTDICIYMLYKGEEQAFLVNRSRVPYIVNTLAEKYSGAKFSLTSGLYK